MNERHEFSPGDRVSLRSAPHKVRRDGYTVVRQFPENASGEFQYRIRAEGEGTDRMVSEIDLVSRQYDEVFSA